MHDLISRQAEDVKKLAAEKCKALDMDPYSMR